MAFCILEPNEQTEQSNLHPTMRLLMQEGKCVCSRPLAWCGREYASNSLHTAKREREKERSGDSTSSARERITSREVCTRAQEHIVDHAYNLTSHTHVYSVRHRAADRMCRDVYEMRAANANKKFVCVSWKMLLCSARNPTAIYATGKMLCGNARQENRQSRMNRVIVCRASVAYSQFRSVFFESSYDEAVFSVRDLPFYCLFLFVVLPLVLSASTMWIVSTWIE